MLRSLFSGISGLRAHQQMMDVTGNNIANVNTTGFKRSESTAQPWVMEPGSVNPTLPTRTSSIDPIPRSGSVTKLISAVLAIAPPRIFSSDPSLKALIAAGVATAPKGSPPVTTFRTVSPPETPESVLR